jgi:hypothetical protein
VVRDVREEGINTSWGSNMQNGYFVLGKEI